MSLRSSFLRLLPWLFLSLLPACKSQFEKAPAGTLDKKQMVQVLIKLHLLEAQLDAKALPKDSAQLLYQAGQTQILKQAGIPEKRFKESYRYYLRNTALIDKIYATVVDSLSLRESLANKKVMEGQAE